VSVLCTLYTHTLTYLIIIVTSNVNISSKVDIKMLNFRKGSLSIKQQIENIFKRRGRKNGTAEKANFDFWNMKDEQELLIPSTSSSSRSSYSSCSSMSYEKKIRIHPALKSQKMLLYILILVCSV
jgi:hypothetical protein